MLEATEESSFGESNLQWIARWFQTRMNATPLLPILAVPNPLRLPCGLHVLHQGITKGMLFWFWKLRGKRDLGGMKWKGKARRVPRCWMSGRRGGGGGTPLNIASLSFEWVKAGFWLYFAHWFRDASPPLSKMKTLKGFDPLHDHSKFGQRLCWATEGNLSHLS